MRIRVTVTLDVDPDDWASEYGIERGEVRADVQRWATNALRQHLDSVMGRKELERLTPADVADWLAS